MGYDRLLLGDGKGRFEQAPYNDRLARTGWSWGCSPWDFDNDGDRALRPTVCSVPARRRIIAPLWRHDIEMAVPLEEVYNRCLKGWAKVFNG